MWRFLSISSISRPDVAWPAALDPELVVQQHKGAVRVAALATATDRRRRRARRAFACQPSARRTVSPSVSFMAFIMCGVGFWGDGKNAEQSSALSGGW